MNTNPTRPDSHPSKDRFLYKKVFRYKEMTTNGLDSKTEVVTQHAERTGDMFDLGLKEGRGNNCVSTTPTRSLRYAHLPRRQQLNESYWMLNLQES